LLYVPLPLLLWAAVRFGLLGASTTIFLMALLAIWGSIHGGGPFAGRSPEEDARSIQVFFAVISVMLLLLAASIGERRNAEERFTKAFFSGPEAMIISRLKDGHIIEVNERCEKMFGRQRGEIISRMMFDLNASASEGGQRQHELELCLRSNAGELRHTQISAVTDDIGGERCFIILLRDITDRKRGEEAQQNLAHASRLAVVGELTAMIAHEVNQPLGAILSNAEAAEIMLDSKNPPLDEIRQILSDIREDDQRADEAIRRIRTLLRKRDMQLEPLDLNEAISDGLRLVAGDALRRHVQIRRNLSAQLPLVSGDRVHLQQVLLNLIVNGMDAMNDTPELERHLTVQTKPCNAGEIEVMVMDHGHGVSPEKLPRLFDSFFTTKRDGMGLGLSIARSIIEAHRGRIWVENNPVGGAAFRFTVPIAKL
jgi:two-component system sensor kinase FixL